MGAISSKKTNINDKMSVITPIIDQSPEVEPDYKGINQDTPVFTGLMGDSTSKNAMRALGTYADQIKHQKSYAILKKAFAAFQKREWEKGGKFALEALRCDEKCGEAWHFLAISMEKRSDLNSALTCYETALRLLPENINIGNDLGRLAYRLGYYENAAAFFRFVVQKDNRHIDAINNLCSALRELEAHDEAIDILKATLAQEPHNAALWNTIGTIMTIKGETDTAQIFFEESLKHDPKNVQAMHNLANVKATMGEYALSIDLLKKSLPLFEDPVNIASARLSIAFGYLAQGDLINGWEWYKARHKENTFEKMHYVTTAKRWCFGDALLQKSLFISSEQGLGDEIMMASMLPDLISHLGPKAKICLAVEKRLVDLFTESFPEIKIIAHHTTTHNGYTVRLYPEISDWSEFYYFALMADFLPLFRSDISQFPNENIFLKPDPLRVAYWKQQLDTLNTKPKVGILWKSMIMHSRRSRHFTPFDNWKPVLSLPDIQCVNLQYGDTSDEAEILKSMGISLWTPPSIDLKNDLSEVCALCCALDLVMGSANATTNIAAASGAKVWVVSEKFDWTKLGTQNLPWYPTTQCFISDTLYQWDEVMQSMQDALVHEYSKT